jgi:hypothetical protein
MAWGRIDDTFYDHPKVDELGRYRLPCVGLYVLGLSWSNRFLTDGHIPFDRVKRLGGTKALAERLVRVGLWDLLVDGYRIHDFLDYNDSADAVRKRQIKYRDLGKRGAEARWRGAIADGIGQAYGPVPSRTNNPPTPRKKHDA